MKKLYGVLGDPISHSMSPAMHNDLFQLYHLDAVYLPFHVVASKLEEAVRGLKAIGASGFNVTVPHKTTILPLLDQIDPLAKAIGAVNTVVQENGKYVGYNTDGSGYLKGLKLEVGSLKNVLIIGAGGAARAIFFTLADAGIQNIDICNRTKSKAQELIDECPYSVQSISLTLSEAESNLNQYDLIIQTTPIGMLPNTQASPISVTNAKSSAFVSDIIYNPLETRFLSEAKQKGCTCQNGLDMFVLQGALAFEKWTGIFPDIERMRKNVIKQLGGVQC